MRGVYNGKQVWCRVVRHFPTDGWHGVVRVRNGTVVWEGVPHPDPVVARQMLVSVLDAWHPVTHDD